MGQIRGKFGKLPVICQAKLLSLAALLNHQAIFAKCSKKSKLTKLSPHQFFQQYGIPIITIPFISDNDVHSSYGSYLTDKFYYACKHPHYSQQICNLLFSMLCQYNSPRSTTQINRFLNKFQDNANR